jgi:hypothetical protein
MLLQRVKDRQIAVVAYFNPAAWNSRGRTVQKEREYQYNRFLDSTFRIFTAFNISNNISDILNN